MSDGESLWVTAGVRRQLHLGLQKFHVMPLTTFTGASSAHRAARYLREYWACRDRCQRKSRLAERPGFLFAENSE